MGAIVLCDVFNNFTVILTIAQLQKKSSPVHVAPACAGYGEESDHFGYAAFSCVFTRGCFQDMNP
jgi:hypothetical protein